jgi:hypothetical protein
MMAAPWREQRIRPPIVDARSIVRRAAICKIKDPCKERLRRAVASMCVP